MDTSNYTGRRPSGGRRDPRAAFSLVEVTLALGIFAFAITAIFGLLPLGLSSFRQAMDTSVSSQICQRVINDAQQTDFSVLTTVTSQNTASSNGNVKQPLRYFDNEGNEVPCSNGVPSAAYLYKVNTVVIPATAMPGAAKNANLATVVIQIINNPGQATSITSDSSTGLWTDSRFAIAAFSETVPRNQ